MRLRSLRSNQNIDFEISMEYTEYPVNQSTGQQKKSYSNENAIKYKAGYL